MANEMIHKSLFLLKHAIETGMSVEHGLQQAFALGRDAYAQEHALATQHAAKFEKAFLDVAYELGAERNPEPEIVLAALKARLNDGNKNEIADAQEHADAIVQRGNTIHNFIRNFNDLHADDRMPALNAVLSLLSDKERASLNNGGSKLHDKIRDAFQANYRAALNMLSSMTAEERRHTVAVRIDDAIDVSRPDAYARSSARKVCVETWGEEAVKTALGGGS